MMEVAAVTAEIACLSIFFFFYLKHKKAILYLRWNQSNLFGLLTFFVLSGSDNNLSDPTIQVLFRQLLSLDRMSKADKQLVA